MSSDARLPGARIFCARGAPNFREILIVSFFSHLSLGLGLARNLYDFDARRTELLPGSKFLKSKIKFKLDIEVEIRIKEKVYW